MADEFVRDTVSENRHKACDPEWMRHVMNELRGMRMDLVQSRLMASVMRDAADIIEAALEGHQET